MREMGAGVEGGRRRAGHTWVTLWMRDCSTIAMPALRTAWLLV